MPGLDPGSQQIVNDLHEEAGTSTMEVDCTAEIDDMGREFDEGRQEHSGAMNDNSTFVHALRDMTGSW